MRISLDQPIDSFSRKIKIRHVVVFSIIILAILTRMTNLGERVMSHDEVNHVVPSFDLYSGKGYRHDPITHGPLQFHLIALSYFLFGDNDFSSRFPHAISSVLTVAFVMIYYRKYLGKFGSIAAGFFFTISPFMMFYGRYARNEAICAFLSVLGLYAVLRYLEEKNSKWLFLLSAALSLNFTTKETAYIFTAQLLFFLLLLALMDLRKMHWEERKERNRFLLVNFSALAVFLLGLVSSIILANRTYLSIQNEQISLSALQLQGFRDLAGIFEILFMTLKISLPVVLPLLITLVFLIFIRMSLHWEKFKILKSFKMLILVGTLVLPLLAPFPVRFAGLSPSTYSDPYVILLDYFYIAFFFGISAVIGSYTFSEHWWKYALVFFGIYIVFYSTFFTNTAGLATGMIGSLGHWLTQQDVQRGGQPLYYYALLLIPMYEFLGTFGTISAFFIGLKKRSFWMSSYDNEIKAQDLSDTTIENNQVPVPAIFIYWTVTSLIAYTIAGEKMPWLTVHITFSMFLTSGWAVDKIISRYREFSKETSQRELFGILKIFVLITLLVFLIIRILGNNPPFQGNSQQQLQDTNLFIFLVILVVIFGFQIYKDYFPAYRKKFFYASLLVIFFTLSLITFRSGYRASFINYDYPYEFLVYAHAADGPKIVLDQIERISRRTTLGLDIKVAYDNHGLYPYWWYLRNYPNKIVYLENPTRTLEEAPLIIAGQDKYAKLEPILRDNYYSSEYMRLWWPMQDYWNLNWEKVSNALSNADMREALFNIWLNRDYSLYAEITNNQNLTLANWLPSEKMKLYIRKDIAAQMWDIQTLANIESEIETDEYSLGMISRQPDFFIANSGAAAGELNAARGIDIAPDGTIYVVDSRNHRIQQFAPGGELINIWGSYANALEGNAPGGTFNEPWDVAVGEDGFIFVADTFNHRIQKFNPEGRFIKSWGVFAQGDSPDSFWGPRGIAISPEGNILVTDTGNKRVVVFDEDLNFITQFGGAGFEAGQFDEPVGIEVDDAGLVYVTDTWNRRVQIFSGDVTGANYSQISEFDVEAWYGQSIDNKPYITVSPSGRILISDPEAGRVLEFAETGEFIRGWQDLSISSDLISQPYGIDFDASGDLWVADGLMNVIMRFSIE